jgi:hypothetical protein
MVKPTNSDIDSVFFDIDLDPARKEGETFEEYRKRRKSGNERIKLHLKGRRIK